MSSASNGNGNGNGRAGNAGKSVIDRGTVWKGILEASSPVVVMGVLEGELGGPAAEVEEGGVLLGRAKVITLRSRGELAGEFDAEEADIAGRVRDGTIIRARSLVVGAASRAATAAGGGDDLPVVFGDCQLEIGEAPSKEDAIARATAVVASEPLAATVVPTAPAAGEAPVVVAPGVAPMVATVALASGESAAPPEGEPNAGAPSARRSKRTAERPNEGGA